MFSSFMAAVLFLIFGDNGFSIANWFIEFDIRYRSVQEILDSHAYLEVDCNDPDIWGGLPFSNDALAATVFGIQTIRIGDGNPGFSSDAMLRCGPIKSLWGVRGDVSEATLNAIVAKSSLRSITVRKARSHESGYMLRALARSGSIESITLLSCTISADELNPLWRMPNLQSLDLRHCTIVGDTIAEIEKSVKMSELSLAYSEFDMGLLETLSIAPCLNELDLTRTKIHGSDLLPFSRTTTLCSIRLVGCDVSDADTSVFAEFPHIKKWDLRSTKVGDAVMEILALNGAVEVIIANRSGVTNLGLSHLEAAVNLKELSVSETACDESGLNSVRHMVSLHTFWHNGIRDLHKHLARLRPEVFSTGRGKTVISRRSLWRRWLFGLSNLSLQKRKRLKTAGSAMFE